MMVNEIKDTRVRYRCSLGLLLIAYIDVRRARVAAPTKEGGDSALTSVTSLYIPLFLFIFFFLFCSAPNLIIRTIQTE